VRAGPLSRCQSSQASNGACPTARTDRLASRKSNAYRTWVAAPWRGLEAVLSIFVGFMSACLT